MGKNEWQELFAMIDESGAGSIPTTKFALAIRAAGGYPTEEQIKKMIQTADPSNSGKITIDGYISQMEWILKENPLNIAKTTESFAVFDKDENGTISKVELSHVLTSMGEKLTVDEAEEFVKEAIVDKDGMIKYKDFIDQCTEAP